MFSGQILFEEIVRVMMVLFSLLVRYQMWKAVVVSALGDGSFL
jgi:hypothetical protein